MPNDFRIGEKIDSRYKLKKYLGGGRVGRVYLAQDLEKNQDVAIKILLEKLSTEREKNFFAREFAAIKNLSHPGVVKVFEKGENYFTMEYIEGLPLSSLKESEVSYIFEIGIDIIRVLDYIHRQGVIHRDLKSENIKIIAHNKVKILDFGFATCERIPNLQSSSSNYSEIVGTIDYMAPEMIKGFQVDPRADLYSLGIIFYELTTGQLPFKSTDIAMTVVKQIEAPPLPPSHFTKKITPGFENIILKLIEKSPSKRFQSTDELLSAMLRLAGRSEFLNIRIERGRRYLNPPSFIALEQELSKLSEHLQRVNKSRGSFVAIRAQEGLGKTRLLKEFAKQTSEQLFTIDCQQHLAGFLPVYQKLLEDILAHLAQTQPEFFQQLKLKWSSTLAQLFPSFSPELLEEVIHDQSESEEDLSQNVSQILIEIAKKQFLGIVLDNLDWLDQKSCELLFDLAEKGQNCRLLIVGTFRPSLKTAESSFEKILPRFRLQKLVEEIELKPLTEEQLLEFLTSMMGKEKMEDALLKRFYDVSRGIPGIAQEIMKNLADEGLIFRKGGVWQVEIDDLRKIKRPSSLEESLIEKYSKLDELAAQIIQAAVIIGRRFDKEFLFGVVEASSERISEEVDQLVHQGFLTRVGRQKQSLVIGSSLLAEMIYDKITPKVREGLHLAVARWLEDEAEEEPAIEELAYHYSNTTDLENAYHYLMQAGTLCEKQYLYNRAIENYQKALEISEKSRAPAQILELLTKLGDIYLKTGKHQTSLSFYSRGLKLARQHDQNETAFLKGIGLAHFRKGDFEEALEHFEILLDNLRLMNREIAEELSLMAEIHIAMGDQLRAEPLLREALEIARFKKNRVLQARIYHSFAEIHFMIGQWPNAMNYYLRAFDILQAIEEKHLKARIAKGIAQIYIHKGMANEAYKYLEEALYLCQLTGDLEFQILIEVDLGLLFEYRGQLNKSIAIYCESLEKAQERELPLEQAYAALYLGRTQNLRGKSPEAIELITRSLEIFKDKKMQWGIAEANRLLSQVYTDLGEYEKAHDALSISEKAFIAINMKWMLVPVYVAVAEVFRQLGRTERANKTLNKALRRARRYENDILSGKVHTQYALFCVESSHDTEAMEHFIAAIVFLERATCQLELARAYYEYGQALLKFEKKGDRGFIKVAIHQLEKAAEIYQRAEMSAMLNKSSLLIQECEREETDSFYKRDLSVKLREFDHEVSDFEKDTRNEIAALRKTLLEEVEDEMEREQLLAEMEKKLQGMEEKFSQRLEEIKAKNSQLVTQVDELKAERESLLTLQKISNTINSVLDSDKLLNLIMDMVIKELKAERGFLVLKDDNKNLIFKAARNIDKEELAISTDTNLSTSIVKKVIKTGEAVLTSDAQADGRFQSQSIAELKLSSILCVPFKIKDKILGAVYVDNRFVSGLFTEKDLAFLVAFSNQAAIAIENAFLYEELTDKERIEQELSIAARIQAGLLPKTLPKVEGIEVFGKMIPARQVGGDYYDYIISSDESNLFMVIGDVSGKGIPAGLVMVMARLILNYFLKEDNYSTKKTLLATNQLLKDNTEPFMFMSMLLLKWDSQEKTCTYTGGGHENIVICRRNQDIEVIPAGGVVLGVKDDIADLLEEKKLHLEVGDTIILYTDGVTECVSSREEMLEMEGFIKMVKKHQKKAPREMVNSLFNELEQFMGGLEQHDDVTLTVLRRTC